MLAGCEYRDALDIGTGAGLMAIELARLGYSTTAIDRSQDMLDTASELTSRLGLDVNYLKKDAHEPLMGNKSFDVIVSKDCVWNPTDPESAYRSWFRILRPGGRLIVMDNNFHYHCKDGFNRERYGDLDASFSEMGVSSCPSFKDFGDCLELAEGLPLTGVFRPGWDTSALMRAGFDNIKVQCLDPLHNRCANDGSKALEPMTFVVTASKPYEYTDLATSHMLRSEISLQELRMRTESIHARLDSVLKCLSNEGCRKILIALCSASLNVTECAYVLDVSHALASHDLRLLKDAGVVESSKVGKESVYRIRDKDMVCRLL